MMEIGELLKKSRIEKELTLDQVSKKIKISVDKLKALESENFLFFPSNFYAKIFLKTYSTFLGIEIPVDSIFRDTPEEKVELSLVKTERRKFRHSIRTVPAVIAVSILLIAAVLVFLYIRGPVWPDLFHKKKVKVEVKKEFTAPGKSLIMVKGITSSPTWIRVSEDGKLKEERILKEGTTYYWESGSSLKIKVGYVPGIDLYYRNSPAAQYMKIDIAQGSRGGINEIEFINNPSD